MPKVRAGLIDAAGAKETAREQLDLTKYQVHLQTVVVDARGHMLGRLASIVAKQLLNGQHVVSGRARKPLQEPLRPSTASLFSPVPGDRANGGDLHIRRNRATEDEVRALPAQAYEHTAQEGSHPLQGALKDLLANSQGVRSFP